LFSGEAADAARANDAGGLVFHHGRLKGAWPPFLR
jgi:hypothetical protein